MLRLIVAIDDKCGIGRKGELPWSSEEDMKFFRETTLGGTVIMGSVTFESIGRPLPKRRNIVISSKNKEVKGVDFFKSLESALQACSGEDVFIIGGESIYREALEKLVFDEIFISHIKGDYECDKFFPLEMVKNKYSLSAIIDVDGLFVEVYVP